MLVIRLQRTGRKNEPTYRLVVAENSAPVKGNYVELVGHYLPSRTSPVLTVDAARITHWVSKGAKASDTVARLLTAQGIAGLTPSIRPYAKRKPRNAAEQPSPAEAAAPAESAPAAETPAEAPAA